MYRLRSYSLYIERETDTYALKAGEEDDYGQSEMVFLSFSILLFLFFLAFCDVLQFDPPKSLLLPILFPPFFSFGLFSFPGCGTVSITYKFPHRARWNGADATWRDSTGSTWRTLYRSHKYGCALSLSCLLAIVSIGPLSLATIRLTKAKHTYTEKSNK